MRPLPDEIAEMARGIRGSAAGYSIRALSASRIILGLITWGRAPGFFIARRWRLGSHPDMKPRRLGGGLDPLMNGHRNLFVCDERPKLRFRRD